MGRKITEPKYRNKISENRGLYSKYGAMKARCNRKTHPKYKDYGGRGITICDEWLDKDTGFDAFADWALSHGYRDDLTIERIDVNGNYCPENCRWATNKEQAQNKQNTRWVEYKGERMSLPTLCEKYGLNYYTMHDRLYHIGMSVEEAVETPKRENVTEFARKCHEHGINIKTAKTRMNRFGWSEERALNTPTKPYTRHKAKEVQ